MSASPGSGITVYTSSGNTYVVANGASAETAETITGDLTARVYGPEPEGAWLASFSGVEAVCKNGTVVTAAANRGAL